MKYKVVISCLHLDTKKVRGDVVELTEEEAKKHGTKIEPYFEAKPVVKKTRRKKVSDEG